MMSSYLLLVLFVHGVFSVGTDEMLQVEVMEGDSVTLDTCVIKVKSDYEMEWKFGPSGALIAKISGSNVLLYDTDDGRFGDRLQLNSQTGDLTVRNTRDKHSGLYELKILNSTHTVHKRFDVTVLDAIPKKVSVTEGDSVTLPHDITDIQKYDLIKWMFGNTLIAEINRQKSGSPLYYGDVLEGTYRDRLQLDDQTGSLTITDIRTSDSGRYNLQATLTNHATRYRTLRLTVSAPGLSSGVIAGICVSVLIVLAIGGVLCRFCYVKKTKQSKQQRSVVNGDQGSDQPLKN